MRDGSSYLLQLVKHKIAEWFKKEKKISSSILVVLKKNVLKYHQKVPYGVVRSSTGARLAADVAGMGLAEGRFLALLRQDVRVAELPAGHGLGTLRALDRHRVAGRRECPQRRSEDSQPEPAFRHSLGHGERVPANSAHAVLPHG